MVVKTNKLWILLGILLLVIAMVLALIVATPPQQKPQPDTPPHWNDTPNRAGVERTIILKTTKPRDLKIPWFLAFLVGTAGFEPATS